MVGAPEVQRQMRTLFCLMALGTLSGPANAQTCDGDDDCAPDAWCRPDAAYNYSEGAVSCLASKTCRKLEEEGSECGNSRRTYACGTRCMHGLECQPWGPVQTCRPPLPPHGTSCTSDAQCLIEEWCRPMHYPGGKLGPNFNVDDISFCTPRVGEGERCGPLDLQPDPKMYYFPLTPINTADNCFANLTCSKGFCSRRCASHSDCGAGTYCELGGCIAFKHEGDYCYEKKEVPDARYSSLCAPGLTCEGRCKVSNETNVPWIGTDAPKANTEAPKVNTNETNVPMTNVQWNGTDAPEVNTEAPKVNTSETNVPMTNVQWNGTDAPKVNPEAKTDSDSKDTLIVIGAVVVGIAAFAGVVGIVFMVQGSAGVSGSTSVAALQQQGRIMPADKELMAMLNAESV